jgi:hypothetical protein
MKRFVLAQGDWARSATVRGGGPEEELAGEGEWQLGLPGVCPLSLFLYIIAFYHI